MPTQALLQEQRKEMKEWTQRKSYSSIYGDLIRPIKVDQEEELKGIAREIGKKKATLFRINLTLARALHSLVTDMGVPDKSYTPLATGQRGIAWKKVFTYSVWEKAIIIVAVVCAIISFVFSLIYAFPDLMRVFEGLMSTAHAAGPRKTLPSNSDYSNIKDLCVTGFAMVLCLYSAAVGYHSDKNERAKFARDLVKIILGFLFGRKI